MMHFKRIAVSVMIIIALNVFYGEYYKFNGEKCIMLDCTIERRPQDFLCHFHTPDIGFWERNNKRIEEQQERLYQQNINKLKQENKSENNSYVPKSSSGHKSYYDAYDDGYEDVFENGDYDLDRYYKDLDYASGVDDAMDELGEDW